MGFDERYVELEAKFRQRVKDDWQHGVRSLYWPVIPPKGPVDYVLIGMEPSTGRKITEPTPNYSMPVPHYNQAVATENFLLNHCVRNYLCRGDETYHLTDLSKGAMAVKDARGRPWKRWEMWYQLLEEELRLLWKPGKTRIIAVGRKVESFLGSKGLCKRVEYVLHFNKNGVAQAAKRSQRWADGFEEFTRNLRCEDFDTSVRAVLSRVAASDYIEGMVASRRRLTPGRRWLMFYYKNRFEEIRESRDSILLLS